MKNNYKITKEEHHWTSEEKTKWCGYGEWVEEADVVEFEYLGYKAAIIRILKREPFAKVEAYFGGHLCGYVQIPKEHPYFASKDRNKIDELDCHGGITFNEAHEEHWVGYDCGHLGDYVPTMEHMRRTMPELKALKEAFPLFEGYEQYSLFNPVYRNVEYCIESCQLIIEDLIKSTAAKQTENA